MTDTVRAYAVGDSVISTRPLVTTPLDPADIRVEIPLASRGTVVDVWVSDYPLPYRVRFEVGDNAHVEINVTEEQIGRVAPSEPTFEEIVEQVRADVHVPSARYPHEQCPRVHSLNIVLLMVLYGFFLNTYTVGALILTAGLTGGIYAYSRKVFGIWTAIPLVLLADTPQETEHVEVTPRSARAAWLSDIVLALALLTTTVASFVNLVNPNPTSAVLYALLCGTTVVAWVARMAVHGRASRSVSA